VNISQRDQSLPLGVNEGVNISQRE
jgi:hypothetical protein